MEQDFTELVTRLVFQLAIILVAAKLGGEVCERYLKVPPVLGELVAGIIIGPFALGGLSFLGLESLFEKASKAVEASGGIPVSLELFSLSQIAAVVLLFAAGLETNLKQFLRYAGPASLVAVGGVALPFAFGMGATLLFKPGGLSGDALLYSALFMGAVMSATSVGITARVLSEKHKLDTPEGVTILAAAVIDDVLGILVLTVVVGMATPGEQVSASGVALIGGKALGFWLALVGGGILVSRYISRVVGSFRVSGARVALALAIAFLCAALAESFGLAMIIGAYSIGLALSGTPLARQLEEPITAVYHALVPIFFVVMGMMVDVTAMGGVVFFGTVITALAVVSKVVGCGIPALATGFNRIGAWRIGIGMLPRGEVALIVAGIGLSRGVIETDLFGVSIMMTIATTLIAPIIMVSAFGKGGAGRRGHPSPEGGAVDVAR
ncbi:MAG: cation:proton antiporter [Dehalococcoidia bacterium]|nr:cation:proton antiporter [Dehalococcoidia bacterium]